MLTPEDYAAAMDQRGRRGLERAPVRADLVTAWAGRREILATNPEGRWERRKPARRGDCSIPRSRLDKLFTDNQRGLRERVLWRMLYETAARAEEILSLNIEDL
ncbi:site-specific integrase [Nonomuraea turkmeniaca]|uniref:site-specific integrase n=1 Tax=Nonomuraea turkmeniaca TaxID=103838 RepID=UPI001B88321E|nr:site-specific integrase [Nonomuraea turkmeniaca]